MASVSPKRVSDFKPLFGNLAQTSHYQLFFGGLSPQLINYLIRKGVSTAFISQSAGLLCYSASLPTTSFAPKAVDGNFTGLTENFAVARQYSQIGLDFYVDSEYQLLKFLESWSEFIASGSHYPINSRIGSTSQLRNNYFVRMQYPEYYKSNLTRIIKFDRDYESEIEYNFVGLWPISMSPPQVSYTESGILKVSATFQYDRYVSGAVLSFNEFIGNDTNKSSNISTKSNDTSSSRTLIPIRGQSGVVFYDSSIDTVTTAKVNNRFFTGTGQPTFE